MAAMPSMPRRLSAAVTTVRPSCRGVAFVASGFVVASALLPPAEVLLRVSSAASAHDKLRALTTLTTLDQCALLTSAAAAGVALAQLSLLVQFSVLPAKRAATLLRATGAALSVVALAVLLLLGAVLVQQEHESVWGHSRAFVHREDVFEARVNDVYCHSRGAQICEFGSLAEAKEVFPLQSWPVGMSSQPGKSIRSSCHGFDDSVRQWGYPVKMELCRVCHAITKEEQRGGDELLRAVQESSLAELQWCGAYLVNDERAATHTTPELRFGDDENDDAELTAARSRHTSPYRMHRVEFQRLLAASQPGFTLALGVPALAVVVASAVPGLLALFYSLAAGVRRARGSDDVFGKVLV